MKTKKNQQNGCTILYTIIEWRVKPRPIRLHINKTYAVCCPSDVSAGLIFSSYTCQSSRTYVYDILCAEIPHIL